MNELEIKDFIQNNLLTKHEALKEFNITSTAFDNYVRRSKFEPFIKKGPRINLYLKQDLERFFSENTLYSSSGQTEIKVTRKKQIKTIRFGKIDAVNNNLQDTLKNIIERYALAPVSSHIEVSDVSNNTTEGKRTEYSFSKEDIKNIELQKYIKATLVQLSTDLTDKELAKAIDNNSFTYDYLSSINLNDFKKEKPLTEESQVISGNKLRTYNFLGQNYTFTEFIYAIKNYLRCSLPDPKGQQLDIIVKSAIRKNGFEDPDAFLNKYIWKR